MVKGTVAFKNKTLGLSNKRFIVIINLASVGGTDSCQIRREGESGLEPGPWGSQAHRVLGLGSRRKQTHTQVSVPEASASHFSCFFANLRGNPEDAGGLLHDPDQQVVDVVFQLAHLTLLLAYRFLLFEDKLDQLLVGQLCISKRGFRGLVFLWRGRGEK